MFVGGAPRRAEIGPGCLPFANLAATPTKHVWYYEHPYPPGVKSYSKTKPIRIHEFTDGPDCEKKWWKKRKETERSWKVPVEQIKTSGYNLDIKNPHDTGPELADPDELLADYQRLLGELQQTRDRLKRELRTALQPTLSVQLD